jgi:hypothetical protein
MAGGRAGGAKRGAGSDTRPRAAAKKSAKKSPKPVTGFDAVFAALKAILTPYAPKMNVLEDKPGRYTLLAGYSETLKKDVWFASVVVNKSYVSFHLMPIYMNAPLQAAVSPELQKRKQGKACFNFRSVEPKLIGELKTLTKKGAEHFRKAYRVG